ncbi:hypothetical protein CAPTEDRAFT_214788 [Capitella teleta]|uniref:Uncharacterized protein n=1 Tax=Capitella teleta TaxID=283909 RepID=R7UNS0_CAPTE|nr:hypothetical protein CAPTEDRAFT_214788 [Capitella teleta]|eukprot:ELU05547.1 hypothetical protein CAPTEDRAFT_214788 [Capitella teleta]
MTEKSIQLNPVIPPCVPVGLSAFQGWICFSRIPQDSSIPALRGSSPGFKIFEDLYFQLGHNPCDQQHAPRALLPVASFSIVCKLIIVAICCMLQWMYTIPPPCIIQSFFSAHSSFSAPFFSPAAGFHCKLASNVDETYSIPNYVAILNTDKSEFIQATVITCSSILLMIVEFSVIRNNTLSPTLKYLRTRYNVERDFSIEFENLMDEVSRLEDILQAEPFGLPCHRAFIDCDCFLGGINNGH